MRVKLLTFGLVIPVCAATLFLMTAARPEAAVHAAATQAAAKAAKPAASPVTEYGYKVVKSYAHDRRSFTQGFEFRAGVILSLIHISEPTRPY